MKKLLPVFVILIVVLLAVLFLDIKTPEQYYSSSDENSVQTGKIFMSISCRTVLDNMDKLDDNLKNKIPADGIILPKTEYDLKDGQTVFDVLKQVSDIENIKLDYKDYGRFVYISGINDLYEKSCGSLSGWLYKVNGNIMSESCSAYVLEEGDIVEWVYSCDMGKDVQSGAKQ